MGKAGQDVPAESLVTQVGHVMHRIGDPWHRAHFSFRCSLRDRIGETYMSVIAGELSVDEAVPLVSRGDRAGSADAVRYAVAGDLRNAGFEVKFRPTKPIPDHVAVRWPNGWDPDATVAFLLCFDRYDPGKVVSA